MLGFSLDPRVGLHWYDLIFVFTTFAPIIVGFFWMWEDANRRRQPGWLWALLTIPFGWLTVVVYLILRGFAQPAR